MIRRSWLYNPDLLLIFRLRHLHHRKVPEQHFLFHRGNTDIRFRLPTDLPGIHHLNQKERLAPVWSVPVYLLINL